MKQFLVVSYDITDDRRRRKIMQTLEDFGRRVQYSVFECRLQVNEIERLKKRLQPQVKDRLDSIRFYYISADDVSRIEVLGNGKVTQDSVFYMN